MLAAREVIGLDIGGANLKAVHTSGNARLQPFALWKDPGSLPDALRALLRELPPCDLLAVTMTGELCDCFPTKRAGVRAILDAVAAAADGVPVRVWRTDCRFVDGEAARVDPLPVAAANWLALATFAGRFAAHGPALLIDVGSTTTDIVPLVDGTPKPRGRTDRERLQCHELVYTGVRRTPLCSLLGGDGAAELFATTLDVYLILGQVPEDAADLDTADGRPATVAGAHARLARMLCGDTETTTAEERTTLARQVANVQALRVRYAIKVVAENLPAAPLTAILSGSGEFLARAALAGLTCLPPFPAARMISLADELGPDLSAAACAHALAVLAAERELA